LTRPLESQPIAPNYNLFDYFDKTLNMDAKPEDVSPNPGAEATLPPDAAANTDATQAAEASNTEPAALQAQVAELTEQYLRAKADMENLRRRTEDEVAKVRKFAVESFAESLLPVIDSLEAGLAIQEATVQQIREGSEATLKQLQSALTRNKVAEISPPAGTKFDPHHHQAISMVPADQEANTVVSVLQKGYQIADRVLRPALVTVAAPK
jgi:molecular chaperone GrpE